MTEPFSIDVDGMRDFARAAKLVGDGAPDAMKQVGRDAAELVAGTARTMVPRRSGALAGTIKVGSTLRSGTVKAGSRRVPYAAAIHWGWPRHNIRPQSFLTDALARRQADVADVYATGMQELADRIIHGTFQ